MPQEPDGPTGVVGGGGVAGELVPHPLLPDEVGVGTGGFVVAGGGVEPRSLLPQYRRWQVGVRHNSYT